MNENTPSAVSRHLSRRNLLSAGAWAMPVVAVAVSAPMAAASGCGPVRLDWAQLVNGSTFLRTDGTKALAVVEDVTMTINVVYGAQVSPNANSLTNFVSGSNGALWLSSTNATASDADFSQAHSQTVTLTFSESVQNLQFGLTDFDRAPSGAHGEQVRVLQPLPSSSSQGASVAGSNVGPYGFYSTVNGIGSFDVNGQVHFVFEGPLQSVTFQYVSPVSSGGIDLLPLTFEKVDCAP